ncbi:MAG: YihY/virulence factor BrkB family protein [Flavobacteriia bacterium]
MSNTSVSKRKSDYLPWREIPSLIKETFKGFFEEKSLFHGAALAYYTVFAMVPLLYLCIVYFGKIIGQKVMLVIIEDLLRNKVGIEDVSGMMDFVSQLDFEKTNFFMELVGLVVLLVASSAFVVCLRHSINDFFDLEINYSSKKKKIVKNIIFRAVSLGLVAFSAVLVIVFYFAQTILISISSDFFNNHHIVDILLSNLLRHGLAILSNALLFTMIFKYVHDGFVKWKLAFGGALVTSILLYVGQLFIKYYLFNYFFGSQSGGVAGTLFILLAFVYYSSQIIFFGAKFTAVYAKKIGKPIHFKE